MGRSGFNRKAAYATLAMTLAAEAPDIDMFWGLRGPVAEMQHHRGFTHSLLGAPVMALLVTGVVWLWHRWRQGRRGHRRRPLDGPPLRWGLIWLFALLADLSHIFLDWTTSYGVRPFFPFNAHWYAGSFVFIFDPMIFIALLLGLVAPAIFGLADREIGVRRSRFRGQGWAIFALSALVMLWSWRWAEHRVAVTLLESQPIPSQAVTRISVNPYAFNPLHWYAVVETKDFYQTAEVNLHTGEVIARAPEDMYYKPTMTPAIRAAERSYLGRVYLDWSQFPLVEEDGTFGEQPGGGHYTRVLFRDLRFVYFRPFSRSRRGTPLSGVVTIAPNGQIDSMELNGSVQH